MATPLVSLRAISLVAALLLASPKPGATSKPVVSRPKPVAIPVTEPIETGRRTRGKIDSQEQHEIGPTRRGEAKDGGRISEVGGSIGGYGRAEAPFVADTARPALSPDTHIYTGREIPWPKQAAKTIKSVDGPVGEPVGVDEPEPAATPRQQKARVIAVVPTDDIAYFNVFGKQPTVKATGELARAAQAFTSQGANMLSAEKHGRKLLEDMFSKAEGDGCSYVVLVGHSVKPPDGPIILKLPNKDSFPIDEIHRLGADHHLQCIIVACYGSDLGADETITMARAVQLCEYSIGPADSDGNFPIDRVVAQMERKRVALKENMILLSGSTSGVKGDSRFLQLWETRLLVKRPNRLWLGLSLALAGLGLLYQCCELIVPAASNEGLLSIMTARFVAIKNYERILACAAIVLALGCLVLFRLERQIILEDDDLAGSVHKFVAILSAIGISAGVLAAGMWITHPNPGFVGAAFHCMGGAMMGTFIGAACGILFCSTFWMLFVVLTAVVGVFAGHFTELESCIKAYPFFAAFGAMWGAVHGFFDGLIAGAEGVRIWDRAGCSFVWVANRLSS